MSRCLKRLGKNSKPYYPDEIGSKYASIQSPDFLGQILADSTIEDINVLEIYNLKEKLRVRDPKSSLPELEDMSFLRDLGLIKEDEGVERLTIAGLLFVGKETAINRLLPQFRLEVEDFSEKVFQEALLNALSHRDYLNMGAVYVKHYPDRIVIENPGTFPEGVNEKNIIMHLVKFIASEQDKLQKILPLPELMILRYLTDNKRIILSEAQELTQLPLTETRKSCNNLVRDGLIGLSGKEYMLTAKVYDAIKSDVEYTQDTVIRYVKAKSLIEEYLQSAEFITNEKIRELCGFTRQQARTTLDRMRSEGILRLEGRGRVARYYRN